MKTLILMLALTASSAFAQSDVCTTSRTFQGTSAAAGRFSDRCDVETAEAHALNKCRRAGYVECRRPSGRGSVQVLEGGAGQICIVTVRGTKLCD